VSESLAETIQKTLALLLAPDLHELKVLAIALQERIEQPLDPRGESADSQFEARMAALGRFSSQIGPACVRAISALSERVAFLEALHQ
jgi:hypothetical protein